MRGRSRLYLVFRTSKYRTVARESDELREQEHSCRELAGHGSHAVSLNAALVQTSMIQYSSLYCSTVP